MASLPPADRSTLLRGLGGIAVGFLLVFVGYAFLGDLEGTVGAFAAGLTTLVGIILALLSLFFFVLPPILPAK